ncbi:MAG TPA: hypothetical protein VFW62_10950 [bacterium]|nr:hypothetical protein [bacterium]
MGENAQKSVPAKAGGDFSFGFEGDFVSSYVWRGIVFSDGPALQPSMWLSLYGATFSVWGNFVLGDEPNQGRLDEVDFSLSYLFKTKDFFVSPIFLSYLYPHQDLAATVETSVVLGYQKGPFKIFTAQAVDVVAMTGAYFGLFGGSFEKDLQSKLTIKTSLGLGWANGIFNEAYFGVPQSKLNLFIWNLELTWYLRGPLYLRPHLEVTTLLPASLRESVADPTVVDGGLAIGVQF